MLNSSTYCFRLIIIYLKGRLTQTCNYIFKYQVFKLRTEFCKFRLHNWSFQGNTSVLILIIIRTGVELFYDCAIS